MVNIPIWLYFTLLCLCSGTAVYIYRRWNARKRKQRWYVEIDRLSRYWCGKLKDEIKDCIVPEIPDTITLVIATPHNESDDPPLTTKVI